tara:strand:- start:404 stop:1045 length:642 start_codon:yes stop_codon:yes gene_type:complete
MVETATQSVPSTSDNTTQDDEEIMTEFQNYKRQYRDICLKINKDIGFYWWKKYVSSAFWGNVSTPLNLAITLITALTTGQVATEQSSDEGTFLSKELNFRLSIAALIISTLNTFFRPHTQMVSHLDVMKQWGEYGARFERVFYKEGRGLSVLKEKVTECHQLYADINTYKMSQPYNNNFLTDIIHLIARCVCLKNTDQWIKEMEYKIDDLQDV